MSSFDDYSVNMDGECFIEDFDSIDLYGDKIIEDEIDDFSENIQLD